MIREPKVVKIGAATPKCPRCGKSVYAAESVTALSKQWHQRCLTCSVCNASLSAVNLCDANDEIFCKTCYGKQFGPKGYGFGSGAGTLADTGVVVDDDTKVVKEKKEKKIEMYCPHCEKVTDGKFCGDCGTFLEEKEVEEEVEVKKKPAPSPKKEVSPKKDEVAAKKDESLEAPKKEHMKNKKSLGGGDKCHRCGKTVYDAEKVIAPGGAYHKQCVKCTTCNTSVSANNMCDKDNEIYCQACYAKNFGPKGFGFGALAYTE